MTYLNGSVSSDTWGSLCDTKKYKRLATPIYSPQAVVEVVLYCSVRSSFIGSVTKGISKGIRQGAVCPSSIATG